MARALNQAAVTVLDNQKQMAAELEDMRRLNELSTLLMREENKFETCCDEITRTAIAISGADKGNMQVFDEASRSLRIVAQHQGVIFGIVTAPANATIDDTIRYTDAAEKVFLGVPDTRFTFQITFPDNGFGGMVLKPWGVRKTPTADYLPIVQHKLGDIPGIQMFQ